MNNLSEVAQLVRLLISNMAYIYKLQFDGDERVYIGQTTRTIEDRVKVHYRRLHKNNHHSKKLQEAYNIYKIDPKYTIIEECLPEEMDLLEIKYISEYNSFKEGFNGTTGGSSCAYGEDAPNAKYCADDYTCVLTFLAHTDLSSKAISEETGVSEVIVSQILNKTSHTYLKELMPVEYSLISRKYNRSSVIHPLIYSPEEVEYNVSNIPIFAKTHNLDKSHLSSVLKGRETQHKGWHLKGTLIDTVYTIGYYIKSPDNIIYNFKEIRTFCKEHGLSESLMSKVLKGNNSHHNGWKLPTKEELDNVSN